VSTAPAALDPAPPAAPEDPGTTSSVPARSRAAALSAMLTLAAGTAASALLLAAPPLPAGDPFRGTLAMLPLLLAALRELRRWTVREGGRDLAAAGSLRELAAIGALVALLFARPALDLPWAEEVLACGLALVLGHRLVRQLAAARPLLGERLPLRPSAVFFFLPLAAYLALLPWAAAHREPDGDEPYYLLITHSLAHDGDADLTNNYAAGDWRHFLSRPIAPQPGDPVGPHGELYSRHNELLPMLLVPAYLAAGRRGALATMAVLTACLAWLTLRLARHYAPGRPGEALAAYGLFAFAPPLLLYSYQIWVEVPGTLLTVLALDRILRLDDRYERDGATGEARREPWGAKGWLSLGLPVLLLPLLKIRFLLVAGPLLALGWWHSGRPRRPLWVLALLLAAVAGGMLLHNAFLYSNPLKIHSWQELDLHRYTPGAFARGGLGLLFDAGFGLLGCAPLWLLAVPAIGLLVARRSPLPAHLAVLTLPYLLIVVPRTEWYGGWSPPFRYALIALPLLAIALVPLLAERLRPGAAAVTVALALLTLALALAWIAVPGWTYNFADGRTYLLDGLSARLGVDLARLFPSSVRPRPATWIWPAATLALVTLLWWLPGRRRGARKQDVSQGDPETEGVRGLASIAGLGRPAWLWGAAALLAVAAALPLAAARLPTRAVELEDPQVAKSGGHLHPDRWVLDRTRYHGGWALRVGERLTAPVVAGGERAEIALSAEFIRNQPVPFEIEIRAGDRVLGLWTPPRQRTWETIALGPLDWPAGAPLVLEARGAHPPGALNGAILDRVDFRWR
jgi:hypothetical protein